MSSLVGIAQAGCRTLGFTPLECRVLKVDSKISAKSQGTSEAIRFYVAQYEEEQAAGGIASGSTRQELFKTKDNNLHPVLHLLLPPKHDHQIETFYQLTCSVCAVDQEFISLPCGDLFKPVQRLPVQVMQARPPQCKQQVWVVAVE